MTISLKDKAALTDYADKHKVTSKHTIDLDSGSSFKLLDSYSNSRNGYQGYAYQDTNDNKIYVVHAGSNDITDPKNIFTEESLKDWGITDSQLVMNIIPGQYYSAKYFLDSVRHTYNGDTNANMEQLGQSLGGTLANMLGMLRENENMKIESFNTLGAASMEKVLKKLGYELSEDYSNINNYFYANEKVSTLKKQVGNVYVADYVETSHPAFHNLATHQKNDLNYKKVDLDSFNDKTIANKIKTSTDLLEASIPPEISLGKKTLDFIKTVNENSKYQIGIEENEYIVQKGDTLWEIAKKCGITEEELISLNPWLAERYTAEGTVLIKPNERIYLPKNVKQDYKIPEINKIYSSKDKSTKINKVDKNGNPTGGAAPIESEIACRNDYEKELVKKLAAEYDEDYLGIVEDFRRDISRLDPNSTLIPRFEKSHKIRRRKYVERGLTQYRMQAEKQARLRELRNSRPQKSRAEMAAEFEDYFRNVLDDFIIRMGFEMHDYT